MTSILVLGGKFHSLRAAFSYFTGNFTSYVHHSRTLREISLLMLSVLRLSSLLVLNPKSNYTHTHIQEEADGSH